MNRIFFLSMLALLPGCWTIVSSRQIDAEAPAKKVGIPYFLPKTSFLVDLEIKDKIVEKVHQIGDKVVGKEQIIEYDATLNVEQKAVPDPDHLYLLEYDSSIFYDDNIKFELSEEGFVKALLSEELDKTSEDKAKEGEGTFLVAGSPSQANFTTSIVPDKLSSEEQALADHVREDLKILKGKQSFVFSMDSPQDQIVVRNPLASGQFKIIFKAEKFTLSQRKKKVDEEAKEKVEGEESNRGIKFKIAEPYTVEFALAYVDPTGNEFPLSKLRSIALIPDDSPVFTLPIERYSLVKATFAAEFKNGLLQKSRWQKPSIFLKLLRLPQNIIDELEDIIEAVAAATKSQAGTIIGAGAGAN